MKFISKGAEAYIFSTRLFGKDIIEKIRKPKAYRVAALDSDLRRGRTKREARSMYIASKAGLNLPRIYAIGKYSIYMEKLDGKLLKDSVPTTKVCQELGRMAGIMHRSELAHGDFTPANVMVNKEKVWLIDFGLSEVTKNLEEKALDIFLMKRSLPRLMYLAFEAEYIKNYPNARNVLARLSEIEKRGRYQARTLV